MDNCHSSVQCSVCIHTYAVFPGLQRLDRNRAPIFLLHNIWLSFFLFYMNRQNLNLIESKNDSVKSNL